MEQKIFSFDSQMINTFQACEKKYDYSFIQNLTPPDKAEALERGDLMHKMLEVYYSLQIEGMFEKIQRKEPVSEVWKELFETGITLPKDKSFPSIQETATRAGNYYGTKMDLAAEEITSTIYQFKEYSLYFMHDSWRALAVEEVGSKVLFETEDLKLIYNFKIDLVAEKGSIIAPFDHKTSKRRENPSSLSNQFIGYCYGLGLNNLVVNKIGFQKTLSPAERFNRYILTIDDERIEEWKQNTIQWGFRMVEANESQLYLLDLTSCDKYSGCIFAPLCETSPSGRDWKIQRDYNTREDWDVAKILEVK